MDPAILEAVFVDMRAPEKQFWATILHIIEHKGITHP